MEALTIRELYVHSHNLETGEQVPGSLMGG